MFKHIEKIESEIEKIAQLADKFLALAPKLETFLDAHKPCSKEPTPSASQEQLQS